MATAVCKKWRKNLFKGRVTIKNSFRRYSIKRWKLLF